MRPLEDRYMEWRDKVETELVKLGISSVTAKTTVGMQLDWLVQEFDGGADPATVAGELAKDGLF